MKRPGGAKEASGLRAKRQHALDYLRNRPIMHGLDAQRFSTEELVLLQGILGDTGPAIGSAAASLSGSPPPQHPQAAPLARASDADWARTLHGPSQGNHYPQPESSRGAAPWANSGACLPRLRAGYEGCEAQQPAGSLGELRTGRGSYSGGEGHAGAGGAADQIRRGGGIPGRGLPGFGPDMDTDADPNADVGAGAGAGAAAAPSAGPAAGAQGGGSRESSLLTAPQREGSVITDGRGAAGGDGGGRQSRADSEDGDPVETDWQAADTVAGAAVDAGAECEGDGGRGAGAESRRRERALAALRNRPVMAGLDPAAFSTSELSMLQSILATPHGADRPAVGTLGYGGGGGAAGLGSGRGSRGSSGVGAGQLPYAAAAPVAAAAWPAVGVRRV